MKCRKNIKNIDLSEANNDMERFIKAFVALNNEDSVLHSGSQSRYDDFVETHLLAMWDFATGARRPLSWAHGGSSFFPWHRELLYQFELLLQTVSCDPTVRIPYWDWTRAQSPGDVGYPFTHELLGIDGDNSDNDRVKREVGAATPYPYDFDPEDWSGKIVVTDPGETNFFQRQFGEFDIAGTVNDAPNLPENDINVTGTNTNFRSAINGANNYTTLRSRSEDLHNLVHRWTGGNMLRMTSPNDPIFFLHHAAIDRMWSIWQAKVPSGIVRYQQSDNVDGHRPGDAMIFNEPGDPEPFPIGATPNQMIDGHAIHGVGVWYDTDIPEIEDPLPSLDFINIPEGLTSYKAVKFKIKGCRQVRFRITGAPTGNFGLTTMGTEFTADPIESDDFFYGYVWIQLIAIAGNIPNSSVKIHAYIVDDEGYYASTEGSEFAIDDYSVTLTATTQSRENNAIALVLDRSGSMILPAGGSSTRSQLLIDAIDVFRILMMPNDEIAVVTFDDVVDSAITMQTVSGAPAFSAVDLSPRNTTWIGGGIQQGVIELATASHTNRSMIVLTDGNENVHPYISELPSGTITNRTYAIGFGLPGEVSDATLQQITSNTNGDLIITGNISTEEQRFDLTKYFVQILAGVTSSQIILDPNGKLYYGSKDVIPFKITDTDVYVDAIALCPIPKYLDFILQTPGGDFIKPTSVKSNVKFIAGQQVVCYRMVLPALAGNNAGSHSGTWHAILSLKNPKQVAKMLNNRKFATHIASPELSKFLPYSFIVHATSNLQLTVWKLQESFKPGSAIRLFATLKEYDVPMQRKATVWTDIISPDGNTFTVMLQQDSNGIYTTSFETLMAGVYSFRIRAEGYSSKGAAFTREQTLTAGVYVGNYESVPSNEPNDTLCKLIHCLSKDNKVLTDHAKKCLSELGFDIKRFIDCLENTCPELPKESIPCIRHKLSQAALTKPQRYSRIKFRQENKSKAVKTQKRKTANSQRILKARSKEATTMFMPLDLPKVKKK